MGGPVVTAERTDHHTIPPDPDLFVRVTSGLAVCNQSGRPQDVMVLWNDDCRLVILAGHSWNLRLQGGTS